MKRLWRSAWRPVDVPLWIVVAAMFAVVTDTVAMVVGWFS